MSGYIFAEIWFQDRVKSSISNLNFIYSAKSGNNCQSYTIYSEKKSFTVLEEFPVNLIGDINKHSGHNASRVIVMMMEYGKDFSGPGKDTFRPSRATGEPSEAHTSNFLHPTFYYYKTLPNSKYIEESYSP